MNAKLLDGVSRPADFNKTVWLYWENKRKAKKPEYLELCLQTIMKNSSGYNVNLLDDVSVNDYINIPPEILKIKNIAHKADWIRFSLLYEYGGIWLDSDVILLREMAEIIEPYINDHDYLLVEP
ncbi:MAG: mannosyltransferase OCH1-like enzyme [Cellvibrionaceae bacterium]|jgi:mannosyltransferase OCH1-like enzyme